MKNTKRIICLLLGVVLCFGLLAACGGGDDAQQPSGGDTQQPSNTPEMSDQGSMNIGSDDEITEETKFKEDLTIIIDNNKIGTIDPFNAGANSNTTKWALNMNFDRLFDEQNGEYVPELVTEWHTEDWQHFNLKLREGVKFHNGEVFTADDVVYTWERAVAGAGDAFDRFSAVESIEVVNDYEININLKAVNVDFLFNMSRPHVGIVNREACEADPENGVWIGTGPWVVSEFVSNDYVKYTRNEEYWGELPKTKTITLKYVAEEASRLIMLENKEVEAAFSINPTDFPYLESEDMFEFYTYTVNNCYYVAFNMNDPITGDINFRKAVASAIGYDDIVQVSRFGYAIASRDGTFWGYNTEFRNSDIERIPYDIEKAKEYLAASSYDGSEVEIVTCFSDQLLGAQALQEQLKPVGINIKIYQTDAPGISSYAVYKDNKAQMICYTGTWNTVASSVRPYYYPGGSANRASYNNPEITELLDLAPTQTDAAEREATYKKIQEIAAQDIPFVTIYNINHGIGALKGVGGMILKSGADHDLSYTYMIVE